MNRIVTFMAVAALFVLLIVCTLSGCARPNYEPTRTANLVHMEEFPAVKAISQTSTYGYVFTVEHDSHRFIVARKGNGVSIINHPSCPHPDCKKK